MSKAFLLYHIDYQWFLACDTHKNEQKSNGYNITMRNNNYNKINTSIQDHHILRWQQNRYDAFPIHHELQAPYPIRKWQCARHVILRVLSIGKTTTPQQQCKPLVDISSKLAINNLCFSFLHNHKKKKRETSEKRRKKREQKQTYRARDEDAKQCDTTPR